MTFQIDDHQIDFILELVCFFLFKLSFFQHFINELVLMCKQEIGSSSDLNSFSNFWIVKLNLLMHVGFSIVCVFLTFVVDNLNILLNLDAVQNQMSGLLVGINEVNDNIVSQRVMHENLLFVDSTNQRNS